MDNDARRAIAHLAEALYLLACVRNPGDEATVPVHIGPADAGHAIVVTPKTAEALADAIDSMNAYMASESVEGDKLRAPRPALPSVSRPKMTDHNKQTPQPHSQELAALELYHQLLNMSPDNGDFALRVTLRLPNGHFVGDVKLSTEDVERMTDSAIGARMMAGADEQLAAEHGEQAAPPLPIDDTVTEAEVDQVIGGFEALLRAEGGQL